MIPDNLAKRSFNVALKRAGLPAMRFHDLRHTAATLRSSPKSSVNWSDW